MEWPFNGRSPTTPVTKLDDPPSNLARFFCSKKHTVGRNLANVDMENILFFMTGGAGLFH